MRFLGLALLVGVTCAQQQQQQLPAGGLRVVPAVRLAGAGFFRTQQQQLELQQQQELQQQLELQQQELQQQTATQSQSFSQSSQESSSFQQSSQESSGATFQQSSLEVGALQKTSQESRGLQQSSQESNSLQQFSEQSTSFQQSNQASSSSSASSSAQLPNQSADTRQQSTATVSNQPPLVLFRDRTTQSASVQESSSSGASASASASASLSSSSLAASSSLSSSSSSISSSSSAQQQSQPITSDEEQNFVINGQFEPLNLPSGASLLLNTIDTNFNCANRPYGYYSDERNGCRIFHICYPALFEDGRIETYQYSFMCGAGTVFDQKEFACLEKSAAIPCQETYAFFAHNEEFGRASDKA